MANADDDMPLSPREDMDTGRYEGGQSTDRKMDKKDSSDFDTNRNMLSGGFGSPLGSEIGSPRSYDSSGNKKPRKKLVKKKKTKERLPSEKKDPVHIKFNYLETLIVTSKSFEISAAYMDLLTKKEYQSERTKNLTIYLNEKNLREE